MSDPASPARSPQGLARQWSGRLAAFRHHRNDEHLEALIEEALRFAGLHLEATLRDSTYWSEAPLGRRVAVLLYLVDRGVVVRKVQRGRVAYEAVPGAESWTVAQTALAPYAVPTLELISALRDAQAPSSTRRRVIPSPGDLPRKPLSEIVCGDSLESALRPR